MRKLLEDLFIDTGIVVLYFIDVMKAAGKLFWKYFDLNLLLALFGVALVTLGVLL